MVLASIQFFLKYTLHPTVDRIVSILIPDLFAAELEACLALYAENILVSTPLDSNMFFIHLLIVWKVTAL